MTTLGRILATFALALTSFAGTTHAARGGKLTLTANSVEIPKGRWVSVASLVTKSEKAGGQLTQHEVFRLLEKGDVSFDLAVAKRGGSLYITPNVRVFHLKAFGYANDNATLVVEGAKGSTKKIALYEIDDPKRFLSKMGAGFVKRAIREGDYSSESGNFQFREGRSSVGGGSESIENEFFVQLPARTTRRAAK